MYECSFLDLTKDKVISVINKETGLELDPKQLTLSAKVNPDAINATDQNDSILVIRPAEVSEYTGTKELLFRRIPAYSLLNMFGSLVTVANNATAVDVWEALNIRYGLKFDTDTPATVTWNEDGSGTMTIAADACFAINGEMVIKLVALNPSLKDVVVDPNIGPVRFHSELDWTTSSNSTYGVLHARLYGVDFTAWANKEKLQNSGTFTNEQIDRLVEFAQPKVPLNNAEQQTTGGMYNSTYTVTTTAEAEQLGANVKDYDNVIVVSNTAWPSGTHYLLHINKKPKETTK